MVNFNWTKRGPYKRARVYLYKEMARYAKLARKSQKDYLRSFSHIEGRLRGWAESRHRYPALQKKI